LHSGGPSSIGAAADDEDDSNSFLSDADCSIMVGKNLTLSILSEKAQTVRRKLIEWAETERIMSGL
jgi:hypothetical protein